MKKRVLVTGGSGFIGSNLMRRLISSGAEVHALIRGKTDLWRLQDLPTAPIFHFVDLLESEKVRNVFAETQPEIVFHLAMSPGHPSSSDAREEMLRLSCEGTFHLLEAAVHSKTKKFIHAGSSMEYGPRTVPLTETMQVDPRIFRGLSKTIAGLLCRHYADEFHLPVCTLRLFSVYGPWETPTRFIPTLLRCALTNQPVRLTATGIRHDYVFVEDVVDALCNAAEMDTTPGEIINIGSGMQWSNEEVADLAQHVTGRKLIIKTGEYPGHPSDISHWLADITKASSILQWKPSHDLSQGLRKTFEWIQQHV